MYISRKKKQGLLVIVRRLGSANSDKKFRHYFTELMCEFMSEVPSEMIPELIAELIAVLIAEMALPSFHIIVIRAPEIPTFMW